MCTRTADNNQRQTGFRQYQDSEWSRWIKDHDFSQGSYSSVKSTLEDQGLIVKEGARFYLSTRFVNELTNELFEFSGIVEHE